MIEKILKAVKSNSKKRGRNITIGAVVGMLLSCTAVMGADGYLWLKYENGIKFSNDKGTTWKGENPYPDNSWDGRTYVNNIRLYGDNNESSTIDYGLKLDISGIKINLVNNGRIISDGSGLGFSSDSDSDSGINIDSSSTVGEIRNNGIISGSGLGSSSDSVYSYGINIGSETTVGEIRNNGKINGYGSIVVFDSISGSISVSGINIDSSSTVGEIRNNGIISSYGLGSSPSSSSGTGTGYGISIGSETTVGEIRNNGKIRGVGSGSISVSGYGINIGSETRIGEIINNGAISGSISVSGYGINIDSETIVGDIINNGVIYGTANAIKNTGGTISNGVNYGLLIFDNSSGDVGGGDLKIVEAEDGGINKIVNYGLAFNVYGGNYKTKDEYHNNFGEKIETSENIIINVAATVSGVNITNIQNLELNNGRLEYKVENNGSFEDANIEKSDLISSNKTYILNGIEDTLKVTGKGNELNNAVINAYTTAVNMSTENSDLTLGNTIINGDILSTGKDNEITISESIINGSISATKDNNTLNLIGNRDEKRVVLYNNTMNIFNNISGFTNINIGNNVAFYEDASITNVGNVNIEKDGILVLRINSSSTFDDGSTKKIIGHALYNSTPSGTGTLVSSSGGKLLLALNGAGNNSIISFGANKLDDNSMFGEEKNGIEYQEDFTIDTTSFLHSVEKIDTSNVKIVAQSNLPMFREIYEYDRLNGIYRGIISVDELRNFAVNTPENLSAFLEHLNDIYAGNPYSYSSELSRKSAGMFRDIVTENQFKPNVNNWLIYGGLTHTDGGNRDTYYGENYYLYDTGSSNIDADTKITGAYMLGEYGVSDTLTSGIIIGGNKLKSNISNGSKVDGSAMYLGAYAKKYLGNLKVTGGAGFQYGDYDADRMAVNRVASETGESVVKYSSNYNDMTYDIYLNGRYSNPIGDNLFLEPYATLSYTYIKQDGADEGSKTLAIESDSKSFDYVVGKIGVDLKKNISHSNGKSTLTAGVSYTKILDGAEEEVIKGRFKGSTDLKEVQILIS